MVKRFKLKIFPRWKRNPLKIWQSWVGLIIMGLIPFPLVFGFIPIFKILFNVIPNIGGLSVINFLFLLGLLSTLLSGFFFGASIKKGKDNFFQYGIAFGLPLVLFYIWLIFFAVLV